MNIVPEQFLRAHCEGSVMMDRFTPAVRIPPHGQWSAFLLQYIPGLAPMPNAAKHCLQMAQQPMFFRSNTLVLICRAVYATTSLVVCSFYEDTTYPSPSFVVFARKRAWADLGKPDLLQNNCNHIREKACMSQ